MSPWAWVAWALAAAVVAMLTAGVVAGIRDAIVERRDGRRVTVRVPRDVDLDRVRPWAGVVAAWASDPRGVPLEDVVAAREAVARAMPDLAAQLDRLADEYAHRYPRARRGPHPCVSEPHAPGVLDEALGLRVCRSCGQVLERGES